MKEFYLIKGFSCLVSNSFFSTVNDHISILSLEGDGDYLDDLIEFIRNVRGNENNEAGIFKKDIIF